MKKILKESVAVILAITLGQFTRNYTQTVKRAADNKRRYAPGWVHTPMDEETADLFKQLAKKMMKGIE